jgi:predicted  nucleic acid-binding Zn-ribbon protein
LEKAVRASNSDLKKVNFQIDDTNDQIREVREQIKLATKALPNGNYLGREGQQLQDLYDTLQLDLKELVIERKQLRAKEADLRDEVKALLAKRDGAALAATTGVGHERKRQYYFVNVHDDVVMYPALAPI